MSGGKVNGRGRGTWSTKFSDQMSLRTLWGVVFPLEGKVRRCGPPSSGDDRGGRWEREVEGRQGWVVRSGGSGWVIF